MNRPISSINMKTFFIFLSLFFSIALFSQDLEELIIRGPYLQNATSESVVIRWRTETLMQSHIHYGIDYENLSEHIFLNNSTTEHEVLIENLPPDTRYFYTICSSETNCLEYDGTYRFYTNPPIGTNDKYNFWILGDAGTKNLDQILVRDAFYDFMGDERIDASIWLGDNAYNLGTDSDHQLGVFNAYPKHIRQACSWLTIGNHELWNGETFSNPPTGPYYNIFTFPVNGEAGGVPSETEAYYSFDYGNVHFVCMNSEDFGRDSTNAMGLWLKEDLLQNEQDWVVAYFHSPPYTRGSHNSDYEYESYEMREQFNPIFERYGVDLVLAGHSHCYERSNLMQGHYGQSNTFNPEKYVLNGTTGHLDKGQAYRKNPNDPKGTVYVTMGCSGRAKVGMSDFPHPMAHYAVDKLLGSMLMQVHGDTLTASFVDTSSTVIDYFQMIKDPTVNLTTVPNVQIYPKADFHFGPTQVNIEAQYEDEENISIYYTTDGSVPTTASIPYTNPFLLYESSTVYALACNEAGSCNLKSKDYVLQDSLDFNLPNWATSVYFQANPNPNNGHVYLQHNLPSTAQSTLNIYNLNGTLQKSQQAINFAPLQYYIDLTTYPKGLYIVELIVNGVNVGTEKVLLVD